MTLEQRIALLSQLGEYLLSGDEFLKAVMSRTQYNNAWLTVENCEKSAKSIGQFLLQKELLENWAAEYGVKEDTTPKKVGLVIAGRTPFAGLHDLVAIFLTGHQALIKLSDKDKFLIPQLIKKLGELEERAKPYFEIAERLLGFDAVIATGNTKTVPLYKKYFGKYPSIIKKNRNTIAVLDGKENMADLYALGNDVFEYYGLGTRNVSKIYVPRDFRFKPLLEAFHEYNRIVLNTKYKNNFDYNYAMLIMNKIKYKANGCIILTENEAITSRIASLHYEFYDKADNLVVEINRHAAEIQCVVSKMELPNIQTVPFGKANQPKLNDYEDRIDTMEFLINL